MATKVFTPFPVLTTERLILRQLGMKDAPQIFALRSDKEINKYLDRQPCETMKDAEKFITKVTKNLENNSSVYWVITLKESNAFAGTICLYAFSDDGNKCEIGYELLTDFQGQGIMKEAAEKVIEYALRKIKIQTIDACTHENNQSSSRLLEKLGFIKSTETEKAGHGYCLYSFTYSN